MIAVREVDIDHTSHEKEIIELIRLAFGNQIIAKGYLKKIFKQNLHHNPLYFFVHLKIMK